MAYLFLVRSHSLIVKTHVLILLALLVVPLFCAASYIREFIAVDSALDSGASYDYVAGRADYTTGHAFIPFCSSPSRTRGFFGRVAGSRRFLQFSCHIGEVAKPCDLTRR